MRIVTGNQNVARFGPEPIPDPFRRVVRLQIAGGGERCERVARAPECLGGLAGSKLSAVPHYQRTRAACLRFGGEAGNICASLFGERPSRIHLRPNRVAVMNEIDVQGLTLSPT